MASGHKYKIGDEVIYSVINPKTQQREPSRGRISGDGGGNYWYVTTSDNREIVVYESYLVLLPQ